MNYRFTGYVLALIMVPVAHAINFDSLRTEQVQGKFYVVHKVEKGETLYSLTRRYGSNLLEVKEANNLEDNSIDLGQELRIPIIVLTEPGAQKAEEEKPETNNHVVRTGETLFSISRLYGVEVQELREWNNLPSNEISIGQVLRVNNVLPRNSGKSTASKEEKKEEKKKTRTSRESSAPEIPSGFSVYYVQSGELIESIAGKFKVRPDSIVIWNKLPNSYLSVGQKLLIRGKPDPEELKKKANIEKLPYGTRQRFTDQSGFVKILEEGTARKIEDVVE
ncbi:MAG: LysM peptidoglycan-binding domain-containing protein, partial [Marinoscillum sp.]